MDGPEHNSFVIEITCSDTCKLLFFKFKNIDRTLIRITIFIILYVDIPPTDFVLYGSEFTFDVPVCTCIYRNGILIVSLKLGVKTCRWHENDCIIHVCIFRQYDCISYN